MSEYIRDLIRNRRQQQIKADVAFLEKAVEGAPMGDPSDQEMAEILKSERRIPPEQGEAVRVVLDANVVFPALAGEGKPIAVLSLWHGVK